MNTYIIAGHAKLPSGIAARNVYETITITLEIDCKYGVIVDCSCTLATEHGRDFIRRLLRGYCLRDGIDEIVEQVQEHYRGKASQAIQAAIKDVYSQFELVANK